MRVFTMGDLHLPFGRQKPMDIFGGWENYTERIEKNWNSVVGEDDCVVIPGDISWAMSIEEALPDFEFISRRLRGRKIISKGNHDYWWTTLKKMNGFLQTNGFDNIRILHNNAFEECGIDPEFYAYRKIPYDELLPWDHIDCGVRKSFLIREHQKAMKAQVTPDCRFGMCAGCGICPDRGVKLDLRGGKPGDM